MRGVVRRAFPPRASDVAAIPIHGQSFSEFRAGTSVIAAGGESILGMVMSGFMLNVSRRP